MKDFKDAFGDMLNNEKWKSKFYKANITKDWETIFGSLISKYTTEIRLSNKKLYVSVSSAPLRQELFNEKEKVIYRINNFYEEEIVQEIILK